MNKIVYNHQISPELIDLIRNSEEYVILISPYLQFWGHLESVIEECLEKKIKVFLITNEEGLHKVEYKEGIISHFIEKGIKVLVNEYLHTKLYLTDKGGIISSMNLYDYSSKNNEELGLLTDDEKIIKQLNEYVKDLKNRSEKINDVQEYLDDEPGCCIRCKKEIPFDRYKPFCKDCFKEWNVYKNEEYSEKFCHNCKKSYKTSFIKPLCKTCY
tara:strand:- start:111 stop:752 length:642 start_codon:yes stop_codon:yes gene_type:complete